MTSLGYTRERRQYNAQQPDNSYSTFLLRESNVNVNALHHAIILSVDIAHEADPEDVAHEADPADVAHEADPEDVAHEADPADGP